MTARIVLAALGATGRIATSGLSLGRTSPPAPTTSPTTTATSTEPEPARDAPARWRRPGQVSTQLPGWPMPPPPPTGMRLCAKPGLPLIYCGDHGYDLWGLPRDYATRACEAWGWRVRVVEETGIDRACRAGTVCRANYHVDSLDHSDVLVLSVAAPVAIAPPPE